MTIAAELVRHLLEYDPETGVFRWKNNPAGVTRGSRAGCVDIDSFGHKRRRIKINGKLHAASNLAWLYMTGEWPSLSVDHINQVGNDDRWNNLRLATRSQQMMNRRTWGKYPRGVSFSAGVFMARITVNGKTMYLGTFDTAEEASRAYQFAALERHGAFNGGYLDS